MHKYKMGLAYDGSNYSGWQIQPNAPSIQSLLEKALETVLRCKIAVSGSGRTDAGVHALEQIAHFETEQPIDPYKLGHAINGLLPLDIRVLHLEKTSSNFHARYSATGKIYHYHLHLDKILNPFNRLYSWNVPHKVNLEILKQAAQYFIGTKDFTAFANEAHKGAASKNGVRALKRLDVITEEGGVRLEFEADGFLYKMVRNITGTLMDVCAGRLDMKKIEGIFLSKDRQQAGHAAPPEGLFLVKVHYDERISSKEEN